MSEPMQILSLGAGVQSTVLALLACDGQLPGLNAAIFADTGWEPPKVYEQVDRIAAEFEKVGIPLYRVSKGDIRKDATDPTKWAGSIPYFIRNPDGSQGIGRRQCTSTYKLGPIRRKTRELLGASAPDFRRVPKGRAAVQWIGFSTDEIARVNDKQRVLYLSSRYPLLELGMSRTDCIGWLERSGWGDTQKSSCIGCPFHGNVAWRDMRDNHPEQWADAVAFDRDIRKGGARGEELRGEAFLHRSMVPLDLAPIEKVSRSERASWQGNLLDLIDEDGDPDGCSPYGCRSGEAA